MKKIYSTNNSSRYSAEAQKVSNASKTVNSKMPKVIFYARKQLFSVS